MAETRVAGEEAETAAAAAVETPAVVAAIRVAEEEILEVVVAHATSSSFDSIK